MIYSVRFIRHIYLYIVVRKTERKMTMYKMMNVNGHVQVYDYKGNFLFSADTEREARQE